MAVGASRRDVILQVLREGMGLAGIGLVLGLPLALICLRLSAARALLPDGPLPVAPLLAATGVLALAAVLAVLPPAVRASSIDPLQALRRG